MKNVLADSGASSRWRGAWPSSGIYPYLVSAGPVFIFLICVHTFHEALASDSLLWPFKPFKPRTQVETFPQSHFRRANPHLFSHTIAN